MSALLATQRSSLKIEITCISGAYGSVCEKEGSVPSLSRDPPAMASVTPALAVATERGCMLELALMPCVGLRGPQANRTLPKGFQLTVKTLAPSPGPFHCVNICAS